MASTLTISDDLYHRILTVIGYPVIDATDLSLTDDQVKDLIILPVLTDTYFLLFPIKELYQATVTANFSYAFPDAQTFGVVDARVNTRPYDGSAKTANPIINDLIITQGPGGRSMKKFGTDNDYGFTAVKILERMERDAVVQNEKAVKIIVNHEDRVVEGYTNTYGNISITWAKYSEDFGDVQFRFRADAIKLAQARLMEYVGLLREQSVDDLPTQLDGADFLQKADTYKDEVMDKWNAHTKVIMLR